MVSFGYKKTLVISVTSRTDVRQRCPFKVTELSRRLLAGVNYIGSIGNLRSSAVYKSRSDSYTSSLCHKYHYDNYMYITAMRNPPCASAREPRDAHHESPGNTTSTFEEQPAVNRTWEEGEEAAPREREREMKRRNGW